MTDLVKIGRTGEPQRVFYTPGSGPLRKSGKEESDVFFRNVEGNKRNNGSSNSHKSETINTISEQLENIGINSETSGVGLALGSDNGRRNRRPDRELYVPKPLAEALANRKRKQVSGDLKNDKMFENDAAGRNANKDKSGRRESGVVDSGEKCQPREVEVKEGQSAGLRSRFVGHGPEPRTLVEPGKLQDLRSIDTTGWGSHHKPPPGRRGSLRKPAVPKPLPPTFDSLPSRLQKNGMEVSYIGSTTEAVEWDGRSVTFQGGLGGRNNPGLQKYMEKNGMEVSYIGSTTEAVGWDGSSVTFQGGLGGRNNLLEWFKTLPPSRGKGRGRCHQEPPLSISLEPLRYSRSQTLEMTQGQFDNATRQVRFVQEGGRGRCRLEPPLYNSLEPLRYYRSLIPEMTQGQFDNSTPQVRFVQEGGRGRYRRELPLYTSLEPLRYYRSLTPEMTQRQFDNATPQVRLAQKKGEGRE